MLITDPDDYVLSDDARVNLTSLGQTECVNITVVNDDVRESNETLFLRPVSTISRDMVTGVNFTLVILDDGDGEDALKAPFNDKCLFQIQSPSESYLYPLTKSVLIILFPP